MIHQTPVRRAVARREAPAQGAAATAAAACAASYSGSMPARGPSEGSRSPLPPVAGRRCAARGQLFSRHCKIEGRCTHFCCLHWLACGVPRVTWASLERARLCCLHLQRNSDELTERPARVCHGRLGAM